MMVALNTVMYRVVRCANSSGQNPGFYRYGTFRQRDVSLLYTLYDGGVSTVVLCSSSQGSTSAPARLALLVVVLCSVSMNTVVGTR
jgi:hypothetical protein